MQAKYPGKILPYILLAPTIAVCILFLYYPAAQSVVVSLYKTIFLGARKVFVGFENYGTLFTSPRYLHTVWISFLFSGGVIVFGMSISLAIALLANQKVHGARVFRTALIWPYALSPAVAGTIWLFLFNPTAGMVTYFAKLLFGLKLDWISSGPLSLFMVIVAATWKNLGYNIVFFLAGLQNIPQEFLEAAEVDGANVFQRFWKITLPLLSPTAFFLLIMNLNYSFFATFGMIDVMTKGGPAGATNIMIFNLYRDAFRFYKSGFAATQSVILFAIVVTLTLIQFRTVGKRVFYGG